MDARRFLVVRKWGERAADDLGAMQKRLAEAAAASPDVGWEHSHVVRTEDGEILSCCVHTALDEEALRAHADRAGGHAVIDILEIGEDARPSDFSAGVR